MIDFSTCTQCLKHLKRYNEDVTKLWLTLCLKTIHSESNLFHFINFFPEELFILENLGFVVSHECDIEDCIIVILVNGYNFDEEQGHYFCLDSFSHLKV